MTLFIPSTREVVVVLKVVWVRVMKTGKMRCLFRKM